MTSLPGFVAMVAFSGSSSSVPLRAVRRARIDRAIEAQLMPGGFDEPAIARLRPPCRQNRPVERRRLVRPDNDLAAVAGVRGRRVDDRGGIDAHGRGGRHGVRLKVRRSEWTRRLRIGIAAAPVAADQHRAAAGLAGGVDVGAAELDVLARHHDRAAASCPCACLPRRACPKLSPFASARPAGLLAPVAASSTIMPLCVPIVFASMTPLLLMTESTTLRAATAVSSTRPPLALSVPSLLTSDFSGCPVETSITLAGDRIADIELDEPVAIEIERESCWRRPIRPVRAVAVMVPVLRTPGATSAAKPPLCAVMVPLIDDRGRGIAGNGEIVAPGHEIAVGDIVRGRQKTADVHLRALARTGCRRD